jgi:hypothetical protein
MGPCKSMLHGSLSYGTLQLAAETVRSYMVSFKEAETCISRRVAPCFIIILGY